MKVIIVSIIVVSIAVILLSIKLIVQKKGEFPSTHVGGNEAMQERDISCHTSQHVDEQYKRSLADRLKDQEKY